ncbi:MAG: hypothetical protein OXT09_33090 [Myxococcales bacterium]|nr:hypothetical protein [Myxococcales bacterium]
MTHTQDDLLTTLRALGTEQTAHLDGSLTAHLIGTFGLLEEWGNAQHLCVAGLYHAAYGTDGFAGSFFDWHERSLLASIVGEEVEPLIYLYAACDRPYTYARVGRDGVQLDYRDRLGGMTRMLSVHESRALLELTFANELEIALRNDPFRAQYHDHFMQLFPRCRPFVSERAYECFQMVFA